ncbi:DinB family protein [Kribbella shirazensis]|uniref:Putative damage-inducible protein DinB n=1 Tax=Kribbella shirazensis TaxID=1105143 RepID=A0A7X5VIB5_9ACTN|nr:DinB family protein [Kribbella shirazensis]NIK61780.1 putative damage-inducible protein DinB [Kribbella shirazensis]
MTRRRRDAGPPATGPGERDVLVGFLDYLRTSIAAKAEGLPEDAVRAPGVPSGTNLLGLVKHLTAVERHWVLGAEVPSWPATFRAGVDETAAEVLAAYRETGAEANAAVATWDDLDAPGPKPGRPGQSGRSGARSAPSRRWTLVHLIEETARHAGHADILREQLDGRTGR